MREFRGNRHSMLLDRAGFRSPRHPTRSEQVAKLYPALFQLASIRSRIDELSSVADVSALLSYVNALEEQALRLLAEVERHDAKREA